MNHKLTLVTLAVAASVSSVVVYSRVRAAPGVPQPAPIFFSGYLSDKGVAVDGVRKVGLNLWRENSNQDPAAQLCAQAPADTEVKGGWFQVPLGQECSAGLNQSSAAWLEFVVDGSPPVHFPLFPIGAVPYANVAFRTREWMSGSRLKAVFPRGADGSMMRLESTWYDTKRKEKCSFMQTAEGEGKGRCLPQISVYGPISGGGYLGCDGKSHEYSGVIMSTPVKYWAEYNEIGVSGVYQATAQPIQYCSYAPGATCGACQTMYVVNKGANIPLTEFEAYEEIFGL